LLSELNADFADFTDFAENPFWKNSIPQLAARSFIFNFNPFRACPRARPREAGEAGGIRFLREIRGLDFPGQAGMSFPTLIPPVNRSPYRYDFLAPIKIQEMWWCVSPPDLGSRNSCSNNPRISRKWKFASSSSRELKWT
jgi:hypothetical protein